MAAPSTSRAPAAWGSGLSPRPATRWAVVTDGEPDDLVALALFLRACAARGVQSEALFVLACLRDAPATARMLARAARLVYPDLQVHVGTSGGKAPFRGAWFDAAAPPALARDDGGALLAELRRAMPSPPSGELARLVAEYAVPPFLAGGAAGGGAGGGRDVTRGVFLSAPAVPYATQDDAGGGVARLAAFLSAPAAAAGGPCDVLLWAPAGDLCAALELAGAGAAVREVHAWGGRGPACAAPSFNWRTDMAAAARLAGWARRHGVVYQVCTPAIYADLRKPDGFPKARGLDARAYPALFAGLQQALSAPAPPASPAAALRAMMAGWMREWLAQTPARIRAACGLEGLPDAWQFTPADPISVLAYVHGASVVRERRPVHLFWQLPEAAAVAAEVTATPCLGGAEAVHVLSAADVYSPPGRPPLFVDGVHPDAVVALLQAQFDAAPAQPV